MGWGGGGSMWLEMSPVPALTWEGRAQAQCRCCGGEPSSVPVQMWAGLGPTQVQMRAEARRGILAEKLLGECAAARISRQTLSLVPASNRKRSQPPTSAPGPSILKPKSSTPTLNLNLTQSRCRSGGDALSPGADVGRGELIRPGAAVGEGGVGGDAQALRFASKRDCAWGVVQLCTRGTE